MSFQVGQRWLSESEPELGLGLVQQLTDRTVTLAFPASGEARQYARESAPLRRVLFQPGDTVQAQDGTSLVVEQVTEKNGVVVYRGGEFALPECDLNHQLSFDSPAARLRSGQVDASSAFDLRYAALLFQHQRRRSIVRGFVGGRIDLIPHQLFVAPEVANRPVPRVLLADEVGLGKTIEACLIVHRLIQTGRARRVLVLVPESLVHQWFVELLRRFNLWFHIFDEERCAAIEPSNPNPFLDDQLVLSAISFLAGNPRRSEQAVAASWDVVVVDEAHHLGWAPEGVSPEYAAVEALSSRTSALLLLTATPEQLGMTSHFARLRLLDPDRYFRLESFLRENEQYQEIAAIAHKLIKQEALASGDLVKLAEVLRVETHQVAEKIQVIASGNELARRELLNALVDQHGAGRVMFRNTRAVISGFPHREVHLYPLPASADAAQLYERLADEFAADRWSGNGASVVAANDPRIAWLANLIRTLGQEKILLICRSRTKVVALQDALRGLINVKAAPFHEDLPLVQRDRNAAWFAENDGAQILLASEIGSEGRNFQFAHHLVLFDLPLDPELLEQRIGRLDRIGQNSDIQIHVPFVQDSPQEVLARWFDEGLGAFAKNLRGGHALLEQFGTTVQDLAQDFHETHQTRRAELAKLIADTQHAAAEIAVRLETGRDRLLEFNSFRPEAAHRAIEAIRQVDRDPTLERFMLAVFDEYQIQIEELAPRTYHLGSAGVFADTFPGLPSGGITITLDRAHALAREDIQFLSWDHPLATGALDLILGSERGNCSVAVWPQSKGVALYLETIYLLECLASPTLHLDRFLPPTPLRIVIDHRGNDATALAAPEALKRQLKTIPPPRLLEEPDRRDDLFPNLLRKSLSLAEARMAPLIARARTEMNDQVAREIARLVELRKVNPNVTAAEIDLLSSQLQEMDRHLGAARLRLDALRLLV